MLFARATLLVLFIFKIFFNKVHINELISTESQCWVSIPSAKEAPFSFLWISSLLVLVYLNWTKSPELQSWMKTVGGKQASLSRAGSKLVFCLCPQYGTCYHIPPKSHSYSLQMTSTQTFTIITEPKQWSLNLYKTEDFRNYSKHTNAQANGVANWQRRTSSWSPPGCRWARPPCPCSPWTPRSPWGRPPPSPGTGARAPGWRRSWAGPRRSGRGPAAWRRGRSTPRRRSPSSPAPSPAPSSCPGGSGTAAAAGRRTPCPGSGRCRGAPWSCAAAWRSTGSATCRSRGHLKNSIRKKSLKSNSEIQITEFL